MDIKPTTYDVFFNLLENNHFSEFCDQFSKLNDLGERVHLLAYDYPVLLTKIKTSFDRNTYQNLVSPLEDELASLRILKLFDYALLSDFPKFNKDFLLFEIDQRIAILVKMKTFTLFQIIYKNFSALELVALLNQLPREMKPRDQINYISLIQHCINAYHDDKPKAKMVIGKLVLFAPTQIVLNPTVSVGFSLMFEEDFNTFIDKQPVEVLSQMVLSSNLVEKHPFFLILKHQGTLALENILNLLSNEYRSLLVQELLKTSSHFQPLYNLLLTYITANENSCHEVNSLHTIIIDLLNDSFKDLERTRLIFSYYPKFSWGILHNLISKMDDLNRVSLLLSPMASRSQETFAELICSEKVDRLVEVLSSFRTSEGKFLILTMPIKHTEKLVFSNNVAVNHVVNSLSTVTSSIPLIGTHAQRTFKSFQNHEEISEFFIFKLIRNWPELATQLSTLLDEFTGTQLREILSGVDRDQISLLFYICNSLQREYVTTILARTQFFTHYSDRIFDLERYSVPLIRKQLSESSGKNQFVGFLALLVIYNYLATLLRDGNSLSYNQSSHEFFEMINLLIQHQSDPSLIKKLASHAEQFPLRSGLRAAVYGRTIVIGSARHYEARENLLLLNSDELSQGILLFKEFIHKRISFPSESAMQSIDSMLHNIFTPKNSLQTASLQPSNH